MYKMYFIYRKCRKVVKIDTFLDFLRKSSKSTLFWIFSEMSKIRGFCRKCLKIKGLWRNTAPGPIPRCTTPPCTPGTTTHAPRCPTLPRVLQRVSQSPDTVHQASSEYSVRAKIPNCLKLSVFIGQNRPVKTAHFLIFDRLRVRKNTKIAILAVFDVFW